MTGLHVMTIAAHIVALLLVVVESLFDSSEAVVRVELSASAVSAHPLRPSAVASTMMNIHFFIFYFLFGDSTLLSYSACG